MSSTNILGLKQNCEIDYLEELHNAHGAAPVIWGAMCEEYYCVDRSAWVVKNKLLYKLVPRWKDLSMPEHHRSVLMMTFDAGYVEKKYYGRASKDIDKWLDDFDVPENHVNHWPKISQIYKGNPDYEGIGIWHTSVSENTFLGDWDEEKEEYGTKEWDDLINIYAHLEEL